MSQEEDMKKLFGGFEKMAKQWQDAVVEGWGGMTKEAVASEEFAKSSAQQLDWSMAGQQRIRDNSAQFLDSLEIPKRSDLARLSKQLSNAETRLGDCEQVLDRMLKVLQRMETQLEGVIQAKGAPSAKETATAGLEAGKKAATAAAAPPAAAQAGLEAGKAAVSPPVKKAAPPAEKKPAAAPKSAKKSPDPAPKTPATKARAASAKNAGRASKKAR